MSREEGDPDLVAAVLDLATAQLGRAQMARAGGCDRCTDGWIREWDVSIASSYASSPYWARYTSTRCTCNPVEAS